MHTGRIDSLQVWEAAGRLDFVWAHPWASISSNGLVGVNTTGPWGAYMVEIDGNN